MLVVTVIIVETVRTMETMEGDQGSYEELPSHTEHKGLDTVTIR